MYIYTIQLWAQSHRFLVTSCQDPCGLLQLVDYHAVHLDDESGRVSLQQVLHLRQQRGRCGALAQQPQDKLHQPGLFFAEQLLDLEAKPWLELRNDAPAIRSLVTFDWSSESNVAVVVNACC